MRAPLSFPISRDTVLLHAHFAYGSNQIGSEVLWYLKIVYVGLLVKMMRCKALVVSRLSGWAHRYYGGAVNVMYPEPVLKEYSLEDLQSLLGVHIAKIYMETMSIYYKQLQKEARGEWDFINKAIPIVSEKSKSWIWSVTHLLYYGSTKSIAICLRRQSRWGDMKDDYCFDLSNDEYIDELGMSVYDIFVRVCAWIFGNPERSWHLRVALSNNLYRSGKGLLIYDLTTAKLATRQDRGERIHDGKYVRLGTQTIYKVNAALPLSSIFILAKQVSVSELLINIGNVVCAWFMADRWKCVASLNGNELGLGIALEKGKHRGVGEYIYIPSQKYLGNGLILLPQMENLYCRVQRSRFFDSLSIEYESGNGGSEVRNMHALDVSLFHELAPLLWEDIKDRLARL